MFVGRNDELAELTRLQSSGVFQFVILYGRRRVGKSTLLSHFTQGRRTIFFTAIESDSRRNLKLFSRQALALRDGATRAIFSSWEDALDEVAELARTPLVLVIDEFPYLAHAEPAISSLLQQYCDQVFVKLPLMLILCGSSMSFMENQVLGYQSPLYGRRTAQMKIEPMSYTEAAEFVPSYSLEEKALVFGITGGVPKYLELFSDQLSLKENITRNFLTPAGYLYEEPANLLKQELREPAKYNLIIEAVAKGASRLNDIATRTVLETSVVSTYMAALIALGLIKKECALTEEKNKRKVIYRLADNMFVFWYRYVMGAEFSIMTGDAASLYDGEIQPDMSRFMGPVFETMCTQYLGRQNMLDRLPFKIRQLGRWWGTNNQTRSQTRNEEEIDLLGINEKESTALFGECKFRNHPVDGGVLAALLAKAEAWDFKEKYFMLFAKSGFTPELHERGAQNNRLRLVTLEAMYQ